MQSWEIAIAIAIFSLSLSLSLLAIVIATEILVKIAIAFFRYFPDSGSDFFRYFFAILTGPYEGQNMHLFTDLITKKIVNYNYLILEGKKSYFSF